MSAQITGDVTTDAGEAAEAAALEEAGREQLAQVVAAMRGAALALRAGDEAQRALQDK